MKRIWVLAILAAAVGCGENVESVARGRPGFVDTTNPSLIPRLPPDASQGPVSTTLR
ncbi:MAG TPA: hypothetical protein VF306_22205 [Pirellulales bacterium]